MKKFIAILAAIALSLTITGNVLACHSLSDGEITKVDTKGGEVAVAKADKSITFKPSEKTAVTLNGKKVTLGDLKAGDKVNIDYEAANDVLSITATREG
jgi:hypothetical protein